MINSFRLNVNSWWYSWNEVTYSHLISVTTQRSKLISILKQRDRRLTFLKNWWNNVYILQKNLFVYMRRIISRKNVINISSYMNETWNYISNVRRLLRHIFLFHCSLFLRLLFSFIGSSQKYAVYGRVIKIIPKRLCLF